MAESRCMCAHSKILSIFMCILENSHKILEKITMGKKVRCLHAKINIMSTKNNYCGSPISMSLTQLITNLSVILPLIKNSYYEPLFHMKPSCYSNRPELHEKTHTQADQKDKSRKLATNKRTSKQLGAETEYFWGIPSVTICWQYLLDPPKIL